VRVRNWGLSLQDNGDGTIVRERNVHHRSERTGLYGPDARCAQLLAEVIKEHFCFFGWSGGDEAGALAFAGIGEEGELRDGEYFAPGFLDPEVHLALIVGEDAQTRNLLSEPVGLGLPVTLRNPDEEHKAGAYLGNRGTIYRDGGFFYALEDYFQGIF
jgi:hypothetical protein